MNELRSQLRAAGRIGIVVSSYHERVTTKLLEGALACCRDAGVAESAIDVAWVSGAFELGSVTAALAEQNRYTALVAIGVVIRGETPHFEFVAGETSRALGAVSTSRALPVGFGLLTVDTMAQALERAGGSAGNKGYEAAEAAIRAADVIRQVRAS